MAKETFEQKLLREWEEFKKERNVRLHRFFVKVIVIFAILGLTVSATAYYTLNSAQDSKAGLCAIREDSEQRVHLGEEFLKENPKGIPGISAESLDRSIANSKQTLLSLSFLSCPPLDPPPPIPKESPIS